MTRREACRDLIKRMGSPGHRRSMARFHESERRVMRGIYGFVLITAAYAVFIAGVSYMLTDQPAVCGTDTECAALCPAGDAGASCRANILD